MKDMMIGVDLAKNVFQLHGASMTGQLKFRKKLTRPLFLKFMVEQPAVVVAMEACGSASYWAREMRKPGHEVKLIAPQYVRPFVKRPKNDTADAEAIVIAAQRPEMPHNANEDLTECIFVPTLTDAGQGEVIRLPRQPGLSGLSGLSGIPCGGGDSGKKGAPACLDANHP